MKYVLVTGAFGGMGKSAVELFAKSGFTVFALDKKECEATKNVIPIVADITSVSDIELAFEKVKSYTENLFAIVHFAGIYMLNSLVEMDYSDFDKTFKINLYGAYNINKTFMPMLDKNSKIIITTSELAPLAPLPFTGVYAISKTALDSYAYSLKMELQLLGVSVSVIRAGAVATNMLGASTTQLDNFCCNTKYYKVNAKRFKQIVDSVEAKHVEPIKIAKKALKILNAKKPKFVYTINRNKLLILLNVLPRALRFKIIKLILTSKK